MSKSEESKKDIAKALLILMNNNDYDKISVLDIVNKAGLSHMSYYRNFNSKDEIIIYILDTITNDFIKKSKIKFTKDNFSDYIEKLFEHLYSYRKLGMLLYKANLIHYVKNIFDKIFVNKSNNINEEYNYYFISGGLYNIYYYWLINGCKESPKELALIFNNMFNNN